MSGLRRWREELRLPVMGAPLFLVSGPELVSAQCNAGIIGSFPALNARSSSQLGDWLAELREGVGERPFAVNLIVHQTNARLQSDLAFVVDHRVPLVVTSLGARPEVNDAVHSYGGVVIHDVIDDRFARKAIEKGADGLVAVAAGAGGHAGTTSPFALLQEIRAWFDGLVLLSGAIAHGRSVLAAQAAGADLAYVGSPFIATHEARSSEAYKDMIVESSSADIVYSDVFTGVHGNYLGPSIRAAGLDPADLGVAPPALDVGAAPSAVKPWRDIWGSGQGIGSITQRGSVAELVARWTREYEVARESLTS